MSTDAFCHVSLRQPYYNKTRPRHIEAQVYPAGMTFHPLSGPSQMRCGSTVGVRIYDSSNTSQNIHLRVSCQLASLPSIPHKPFVHLLSYKRVFPPLEAMVKLANQLLLAIASLAISVVGVTPGPSPANAPSDHPLFWTQNINRHDSEAQQRLGDRQRENLIAQLLSPIPSPVLIDRVAAQGPLGSAKPSKESSQLRRSAQRQFLIHQLRRQSQHDPSKWRNIMN